MQSGEITNLEHNEADVHAKRVLMYAWDGTNYRRVAVTAAGLLKVVL